MPEKSQSEEKGKVSYPIVLYNHNERVQMDIIDVQSCQYKDYKFILVYQDHFTKFIQLLPLKTKVYDVILDIFLDRGPRCHSSLG